MTGPSSACGLGWYYGLDGNNGVDMDLVEVLLHEFGHGLGFQTFVNKSTGAWLGPPAQPDIYGRQLYDVSAAARWDAMTNNQRKASVTNARNVVLDGANVVAAMPTRLDLGVPKVRVTAPAGIAGAASPPGSLPS